MNNRQKNTGQSAPLPLRDPDEIDRLAALSVRGPKYRLENKHELEQLLARLRQLQSCVADHDNTIFGLTLIDVVRLRRCTGDDVKAEELHRWARFANTMRIGESDLSRHDSKGVAAAIERARTKWFTEQGAR